MRIQYDINIQTITILNSLFTDESLPTKSPCTPSPCGPNSLCRVVEETIPSCSCLTGFIGNPPYCRPECISNSECPFEKSCINNKCADPCIGACGRNAECRVVSHSPICTCRSGYEGDAFDECQLIKGKFLTVQYYVYDFFIIILFIVP